jgi:hypothetical protein
MLWTGSVERANRYTTCPFSCIFCEFQEERDINTRGVCVCEIAVPGVGFWGTAWFCDFARCVGDMGEFCVD